VVDIYRRFGRTYCFHLQDNSSTLKAEDVCSSETSADIYHSTKCHIPEGRHRSKNIRSEEKLPVLLYNTRLPNRIHSLKSVALSFCSHDGSGVAPMPPVCAAEYEVTGTVQAGKSNCECGSKGLCSVFKLSQINFQYSSHVYMET
jgi:hypothetical protein